LLQRGSSVIEHFSSAKPEEWETESAA